MMHKLRLYGLVALPVALGLAACSKTEVETSPNPAVTADANAAARTDTVVVKTDTTAAVAAAAVAVSADTTAKVADTSRAYQASGQPAAAAQASASGTTQMFTLEQVNGSNFTGQVTLTDLGMGKSRIAVTLNAPANADKDADHKQHIHSGTCAAPGPVVHPLDDIEGNGKPTEDEIPMGLADVTAGNHIVNVHEAGGDRPIACVDLKKAM